MKIHPLLLTKNKKLNKRKTKKQETKPKWKRKIYEINEKQKWKHKWKAKYDFYTFDIMIFYTKRKLFEMKTKEITRKLDDFFGVSAKIGYTRHDKGVRYFLKNKTDWYWFDDDARIVLIVIFYIYIQTQIHIYIYIIRIRLTYALYINKP